MARIEISKFSCIEKASLDAKDLVVIIGPQGSGKSVVTKLFYFFSDIIPKFATSCGDQIEFPDFKKEIEKSFAVWFPPQAWGGERFVIKFQDGNFECRIIRRRIAKNLSEEVTVKFSDWVERLYSESMSVLSEQVSTILERNIPVYADDEFERSWRARRAVQNSLRKEISGFAAFSQTFIPAGRAFFTSIGRLVAGIEHAGSLDPATLKFARRFAGWRDQRLPNFRLDSGKQLDQARKKMMLELFGGVVQNKRDAEYIEMSDGRKVPFSSLSSGQQELLPIWYFLNSLMMRDAFLLENSSSRKNKFDNEIFYIEEPEAHLFPRSQAVLLDALISTVLGGADSGSRKLFITTHSPYIMSRLNVLIKARAVARKKRKSTEVAEIVNRHCWIDIKNTSILCMDKGILRSIVDENENLIDADFIDDISDDIARDFDRLLDVEFGK